MNLENIFSDIHVLVTNCMLMEFDIFYKEDGSAVTTVDIELQSEIIRIIKKYHPEHNIICEEYYDEKHNDNCNYYWIIDPIDGTSNFSKGGSEFAVSVGLLNGNNFLAAYVNFPKLFKCFLTMYDQPVKNIHGHELYAADAGASKELIFCSRSYSLFHDKMKSKGCIATCYYSATYSMLRVLEGDALLYHIIDSNIYDVGPMSYILTKLGRPSFAENKSLIRFSSNVRKIPLMISVQSFETMNLLY